MYADRLVLHTYQAWASVLLVQLYRAMREPLCVERVTVRTPTLFSYVHVRKRFIRLDLESLTDTNQTISMEYRLQFEHLMCTAFDCKRWDFSFVNADYYGAGIDKHPEMKAVMVCALLALSQKRPDTKEQLREWAKSLDDKETYQLDDIHEVLEKLYEANLAL